MTEWSPRQRRCEQRKSTAYHRIRRPHDRRPRRILTYTNGLTREAFLTNTLVQDGVIRNFEVIGEAARNIEVADVAFVERHADIAWAAAQGMRHRLAHGYFRIDLDLVWRAIQRDIPELLEKLLALQLILGK